jgi:hypothetical protein
MASFYGYASYGCLVGFASQTVKQLNRLTGSTEKTGQTG